MSGLTQRYISKELIHFIGRGKSVDEQFNLFIKIIKEGWVLHPPFNPNISGNITVKEEVAISDNEMYAPEIVCFADIPLEDLSIHAKKYSSVGLTFSKDFIARAGGLPVHYIPRATTVRRLKNLDGDTLSRLISEHGHQHLEDYLYEEIPKAKYFDEMLKEYHALFALFQDLAGKVDPQPGVSGLFKRVINFQRFLDFHIFSYFKFFNHKLADDDADNFYFEREWRIVGNLRFSLDDVKTVIFPSQYSKIFREQLPAYCGQVMFMD